MPVPCSIEGVFVVHGLQVIANRIGASRLYAIARALDVPVDFFFKGSSRSETKADKELERLTPSLSSRQVFALNGNFMRIGDRTLRRRIISLIETIGHAK